MLRWGRRATSVQAALERSTSQLEAAGVRRRLVEITSAKQKGSQT